MTLTFNTHIPSYIQLECLLLLTFRSLAAIVSDKSTVFTFPIEKPNKNIIMSSFKSSRDIQKTEGGPDSCFG